MELAERERSSLEPSKRAAVQVTPINTLSQLYSKCKTDKKWSASAPSISLLSGDTEVLGREQGSGSGSRSGLFLRVCVVLVEFIGQEG